MVIICKIVDKVSNLRNGIWAFKKVLNTHNKKIKLLKKFKNKYKKQIF